MTIAINPHRHGFERLLTVFTAIAVLIGFAILVVPAARADTPTLTLPFEVVTGAPGSEHLLFDGPMPVSGELCLLTASAAGNNQSVHHDNDLRLESNEQVVNFFDVERRPNVDTPGDQSIVPGATGTVTLTLGGDGVYSAEIVLVFECEPVETDPGKIIVKKEVTAGSDESQVFTFTESGFSLDDNTLAHGEMGMSGDVELGGDYSVTESVPAGWKLQSATCDGDSTPVDINVEEGETVTCTFVNHEIPDEVSPTTIVSTTTSIVIVDTTAEVSPETLPFTGFENGTSGLLALLLVASGALALVGMRVFRRETDE